MGLGLDPLGTGLGPFGGPGLITIKGVVPIGMSEVAVIFDRYPRFKNDGAFDDASDPNNYLIVPIDPTEVLPDDKLFIPPGKFVPTHGTDVVGAKLDGVDQKQIILTTDCALEKWVDYLVTVLYVKGDEGEVYAGPTEFMFRALTPSTKTEVTKSGLLAAQDPYLDVANQFAALDEFGTPVLQGWQLTPSQAFKKAGGLASTRKRIARRMFAGRGCYLVYGNNYGVDFRAGSLVRPGDLERLQNAIAGQILQEPDVKSCVVSARITGSNMVDIEARVDVRVYGTTSVRQVVAIP
jgi:hypothetical protein